MKQNDYIKLGQLLVQILQVQGNMWLIGFSERSTGLYKTRWVPKVTV